MTAINAAQPELPRKPGILTLKLIIVGIASAIVGFA
jgi:hypothetical protein